MTKVLLPGGTDAKMLDHVAEMLRACGCEVELLGGRSLESVLPAVDAVVVIVTGSNAAEIDATVLAASRLGKRVYGIRSLAQAAIPPSLADYNDGILNIDSSDLCSVICGDKTKWEDTSGEKRDPPFTPHNKC